MCRPTPTINELEVAIHSFCGYEWGYVEETMLSKHAYTKDESLPHRSLEGLYITLLLEEGFGFHRSSKNITLALEVCMYTCIYACIYTFIYLNIYAQSIHLYSNENSDRWKRS